MKKLYPVLAIALLFALPLYVFAQHNNSELPMSIRDDGTAPDPSAILDLQSSNRGILLPRMATTERLAISSPGTGLMVYDINTNTFWCYAGSSWVEVKSGYIAFLEDADGDTKVEVEQTPGENVIHFTLEGTEYFRMDSARLEVINSGGSVLIGEGTGENDDLQNRANVFIGYQNSVNNQTGFSNISLGNRVLYHNTDRSNLVAIGDSALYYNGIGAIQSYHSTANTAVGSKSLFANTTGNDNTAAGFMSMYSNEAGYRNSAFGNEALFANDTGRYNNAFGHRSLFKNTLGSFNVALGSSALYNNITGVNNTAVGNRPLNSNTTGSLNVAVGSEAGYTATGSGNVFLGYQAGYHEINDNKLYINNDSSSMPLVYGEFDNKVLKLNGKLEVKGEIVIEDSNSPTPVAGTIRWNGNDFEGYDGVAWLSLTGSKGHVEDIDGNVYSTKIIGSQTWMAENLRTTKYNNGTSIPMVWDTLAPNGWAGLNSPAYCWYANDSLTYAGTYGALYNYFAVADSNSQNVCPVGWHVPTYIDWENLENYLGGSSAAGAKMKEIGLVHWNPPNPATNSSGFTGLPGGYRQTNGHFISLRDYGFWWSSTWYNSDHAISRALVYDGYQVNSDTPPKILGLSVRCLKD